MQAVGGNFCQDDIMWHSCMCIISDALLVQEDKPSEIHSAILIGGLTICRGANQSDSNPCVWCQTRRRPDDLRISVRYLADVRQKDTTLTWNMVDVIVIHKKSIDVSCDASCRSDAEPCVILEQISETFCTISGVRTIKYLAH